MLSSVASHVLIGDMVETVTLCRCCCSTDRFCHITANCWEPWNFSCTEITWCWCCWNTFGG